MSHRAKALARIADPTLPRKVHREDNTVTDAFLHSKRDKQLIRKATFRARVLDKVGPTKKPLKRRRPSKKLVATLESLADALPDVPTSANAADGDDGDEWEGIKKRRRQQSLRTRPGSMKRKEKVVQAEMARFGLNLAQLTAVKEEVVQKGASDGTTDGAMDVELDKDNDKDKDANTASEVATAPASDAPATTRQSTANRFALLRNYITMTMEQNPAFAKQE